jgi:hypothetical protein
VPTTPLITDKELASAVRQSASVAGVLHILGLPADEPVYSYYTIRIERYGLDTEHFVDGGSTALRALGVAKRAAKLVHNPSASNRTHPYVLRRAMLENGILSVCVGCGLEDLYDGAPLQLQVDHVDGN